MAKKIFTSYSWDDESHKRWVAKLTNDLRSKYGFEAKCDTISDYGDLDTMIVEGVTKSDKIIVVVTSDYTYKAESYIGGVGKETKLLQTRHFKDDTSIVPILRERTRVPAYLESVPYIDFTVGDYNDNLNELVKRLNNETVYKAVDVSKNPMRADDYEIIPDLRINDPDAEEKFLNEEFDSADERILSLMKKTKSQYPVLEYKRSSKIDIVSTGSASIINGQFVQHKKKYRVVAYKVCYNGKTGAIRFWMDCNEGSFGKGIFGVFDDSFGQSGYNSFNLWVGINRSKKKLELEAQIFSAGERVTTGRQLGEYLYRTIMERVK